MSNSNQRQPRRKVEALRFRQWMRDWDDLRFIPKDFRNRPSPTMYLFSMPADQLRALSGVFRRQRQNGLASGIQRGHDKERSSQIRDYVRFGYPYSDMSVSRRVSFDSEDLRKPGWLPTAIVVNILTTNDVRRGRRVEESDAIVVNESESRPTLELPPSFNGPGWEPNGLAPFEVIDGQHRLYAFDGETLPGDFELPVVAYVGLDIGWQAYLFWSINVSPKKINPSHAFDLYPLLRSQDWLDKFAESNVYREARAQELTEFLYRFPRSPWRGRINMLGERGVRSISQAAWIRSLSSTYLSTGRGRATQGLFGNNITEISGPLPWTRPQQAAFLIQLWIECRDAVRETHLYWAEALRKPDQRQRALSLEEEVDLAFAGPYSLLNQEQGVRGFLSVTNEIFFSFADELRFSDWDSSEDTSPKTVDEEVEVCLKSLLEQPFIHQLKKLASDLMCYDWRSADAPQLSVEEKLTKRAFRGTGGYAALRDELMRMLATSQGAFSKRAQLIQHARR